LDANIKDELHAVSIVIELELKPTDYKITRLLETGYTSNKFWKIIKTEIIKPERIPYSKIVLLSEYKIINNRLLFRDRIYIPEGELRLLFI
jgi:hypothetical protein